VKNKWKCAARKIWFIPTLEVQTEVEITTNYFFIMNCTRHIVVHSVGSISDEIDDTLWEGICEQMAQSAQHLML
jgi:hypothetical protein